MEGEREGGERGGEGEERERERGRERGEERERDGGRGERERERRRKKRREREREREREGGGGKIFVQSFVLMHACYSPMGIMMGDLVALCLAEGMSSVKPSTPPWLVLTRTPWTDELPT